MDNPYQAPASVVGPAPGAAQEFRDAGQLTAICQYLLYASIMASVVSIAMSTRELDLLYKASAGLIDHEEADDAIALQSLLLLPLLAVMIACYVAVGMWIHRMATNAWALSRPRPLDHRPGWTVGWYFIPIANLWKPYQALKEVWQVSSDPRTSPGITVPWLFPAWWGLWLAASFASNVAGRLAWRAETTDDATAAATASIVSEVLNIPLCLVFLSIVAALHRIQQRQHVNRTQSVPGVVLNPVNASSAPSPSQ